MRSPRMPDLLLLVGAVSLAAAIGQGQHDSARARERQDPILWQLQIFDADGRLLRSREAMGNENQLLSFEDPSASMPRLTFSILPLGLPNGDLDVQLDFRVNGAATAPLRGLPVRPGDTVKLSVPGQPYKLALRAVRLDGRRRPLVS